MPTDERIPKIFQLRHRKRRAQTLVEVIFAIAILAVIVVMITGDLTNITKTNSAADRSIEISAANFLIGVMKADPGFWNGGPGSGVDWGAGPDDPACYAVLGPYTDTGPSPSPSWHTMPKSQLGCVFPYTDQGAPQEGQPGPDQSPAPVGDAIEYMWNASEHNGDSSAADLTVWVRRDPGSPVFEYHSIRYESPEANLPSPTATPSGSHGGGGGGGGKNTPGPTPSGFGV